MSTRGDTNRHTTKLAEQDLSSWYRSHGCYIRRLDSDRQAAPKWHQSYKKGWEALFPVKDESEASQLLRLLASAGFTPGKTWRKSQPTDRASVRQGSRVTTRTDA